MVRQFRPLPANIDLGSTLARRVNQLREYRNLTLYDLSVLSRLPLQRVEDIQGGLETWLSAADRQLLAKALGVEPYFLQEVEVRYNNNSGDIRYSIQQEIAAEILAGVRELPCPNCAGTLKCSVQQALDLDGNPVHFAKAFCTKCTFVLK